MKKFIFPKLQLPPSKLNRILNEHIRHGFKREELHVLSTQHDPFFAGDSKSKQDWSLWFAELFDRFYPHGTCHVRGLHYRLVAVGNIVKPTGEIYRNNDADWQSLGRAGTGARWLGLVPFERIVDNKNSDPIVIKRNPLGCWPTMRAKPNQFDDGFDIEEEIAIDPAIEGFDAKQPYTLAIYGEKSSLEDVCLRVVKRFPADIYLMEGEFSTTRAFEMAKSAVDDYRTLVVFTLTDCDPQGHNMPTALGRKLHGFQNGVLPTLDYRVIPIALTPQQADEFDLPSTPIKQTKDGKPPTKRVLKWRETFGRDQTEIDSMIELRPEELHDMMVAAMSPFCDETLIERVQAARDEYEENARELIEQQVGAEIAALREEAEGSLTPYRAAIKNLQDRLDGKRHGDRTYQIARHPIAL
jgi:hypothetical protein